MAGHNFMHGNTPYAGRPSEDVTPADRRALRQDVTSVAARARALLPDEFVVGAEIRDGVDGLQATVAVQPPAGSVVSAGFGHGDADPETVAQELAAGAAFEMLRLDADVDQTAR